MVIICWVAILYNIPTNNDGDLQIVTYKGFSFIVTIIIRNIIFNFSVYNKIQPKLFIFYDINQILGNAPWWDGLPLSFVC